MVNEELSIEAVHIRHQTVDTEPRVDTSATRFAHRSPPLLISKQLDNCVCDIVRPVDVDEATGDTVINNIANSTNSCRHHWARRRHRFNQTNRRTLIA